MFLFGARRVAVCGTAAIGAAWTILSAGCYFGGPEAVPVPQFNASTAASDAMNEYDANKDGALDQEELKKVPGLLQYPEKFDANGDKKVDAAELTKRLGEIYGQQVGLMNFTLVILRNGQPLEGAKVRMTPEKFMGPSIKPAEGTSGQLGYTMMSVADADIHPAELRGKVKAVHNGVYKVEVTHPSLPEGSGPLGLQVSLDTNLEPPKLELNPKK
jgi:hypothetical protein